MTTRHEIAGRWDHRNSHGVGIDEKIAIAAIASIRHRVDEIIASHQDALAKLGEHKQKRSGQG